MVQTILILISHMVTFAIAMLPVILVVFYKRLNLGYKYDYQSMLRVVPISVVLIIISAYKVIYIAIYGSLSSPPLNVNASLFFSLAFIICALLSIYFVIDRAILHFKSKLKKKILNVSAGVAILLSIFTIFQLVSKSQENQLNYIDLAMNFMYPVLTGGLSMAGIISLIFYKRASKQQRFYSFVFALSIPLIILDALFASEKQFTLTAVPYIIYIIKIFTEVIGSVSTEGDTLKISNDSFKEEYDLTDREMDVYTLAAQGMSNQAISKKLFVSVHTVKAHMQHIFAKLGVSTRYELINFNKQKTRKEDI